MSSEKRKSPEPSQDDLPSGFSQHDSPSGEPLGMPGKPDGDHQSAQPDAQPDAQPAFKKPKRVVVVSGPKTMASTSGLASRGLPRQAPAPKLATLRSRTAIPGMRSAFLVRQRTRCALPSDMAGVDRYVPPDDGAHPERYASPPPKYTLARPHADNPDKPDKHADKHADLSLKSRYQGLDAGEMQRISRESMNHVHVNSKTLGLAEKVWLDVIIRRAAVRGLTSITYGGLSPKLKEKGVIASKSAYSQTKQIVKLLRGEGFTVTEKDDGFVHISWA